MHHDGEEPESEGALAEHAQAPELHRELVHAAGNVRTAEEDGGARRPRSAHPRAELAAFTRALTEGALERALPAARAALARASDPAAVLVPVTSALLRAHASAPAEAFLAEHASALEPGLAALLEGKGGARSRRRAQPDQEARGRAGRGVALEQDAALRRVLLGLVDDAHAALADAPHDAVAADARGDAVGGCGLREVLELCARGIDGGLEEQCARVAGLRPGLEVRAQTRELAPELGIRSRSRARAASRPGTPGRGEAGAKRCVIEPPGVTVEGDALKLR